MTAAESARHGLYSRLEDVLGDPHASTLMSFLPTGTGDQVATKSDIARLEARFDRLDERMNRFSETMIEQQRFYSRSMVGAMVGLTAIFSLVVTFLA